MLQLSTLQKFTDQIQGDYPSVCEMSRAFQQSIPLLAEDLPLGQVEVALTGQDGAKISRDLLYSDPNFSEEASAEEDTYSYACETGNKGKVSINVRPLAGHHWSAEDREALRLVCQVINVHSAKARLAGIMQNAVMMDNLTGASNLNGLMHFGSVHEEDHTLSQYTGALLNIKNFKFINKEFGILRGDDILRGFCHQLQTFLNQDEILARVGADSFIVLLQNQRIDSFIRLMLSLKITTKAQGPLMGLPGRLGVPDTPEENSQLESYTYYGEKEERAVYDIAVRMGLYAIQPEDTIGIAINNLTSALALSRQASHEDFVWFDRTSQDNEINSRQISYLFENALQNQEFIVYYQPKVTLDDDTLCGCEALVRWIRNGKVVPPMTFIPTLEDNGDVCKLDFYVFRTVCSDIRRWLDNGITPVKVSVNFSKLHLENEQFAEDVLSVMKKYQIDSKYLEIELTETAGSEDYEKLNHFINDMQDCNVAVSIDDFGTGYSSLSLLKNLKVDVIKLDQSFVRDINTEHTDTEDRIVIKNIVSMINELQMTVIAEGVETPHQADFLRSVNCQMAQGYLYDRPIPREEFEKRLRGNRTYYFGTSV